MCTYDSALVSFKLGDKFETTDSWRPLTTSQPSPFIHQVHVYLCHVPCAQGQGWQPADV